MSAGTLRPKVPQEIELRLPREEEEDEFLSARAAASPHAREFLLSCDEGMRFPRYLEMLREQERGVNLPPNHVPSTFLFAFAGTRIVGRTSIRHTLNAFLERGGGHIGYFVLPEFRRRGYATEILRLSLEIARSRIGLRRVLVTCDENNVGSIRTIERNGGVLEDIIAGPDLERPKRRYWIETLPDREHGS